MQKTYIWRQRKQCTTSARNFETRYLRRYCPNYTLLPKIYSVWVFSCKLMQCFPLTLTSEYSPSMGSTSLAEQNYIVTIYNSCEDWILVCKTGNQIHTTFKDRKNPQHTFALKVAAVRYMFCAIFDLNSVAKFFKNTCLKWSWRSCNFTKNGLLQNYFFFKFTFTLRTHRAAFVITVKFPNLLKRHFSKLLLPTTACQMSYLKQMLL